jgi:putative transcription factor
MICEMCGKEVPATRQVIIEGTRLSVCPGCAKFGDEYKTGGASGAPVAASVVEERLQRRERRMGTRDVYEGTTSTEIIDDFGRAVREAREKKGMDLEKFSASINEKKGTIAKVETNSMIPDDKLAKKLEKALGISLRETVQTGAMPGSANNNGKMTLSNFIKKK